MSNRSVPHGWKLERVEFMPEHLEPDTLYCSEKYGCAIHLCPCAKCSEPWQQGGPRIEGGRPQQWCRAHTAIAPFWPDGWALAIVDERPTLSPSILNRWCGAHYWIRDGGTVWA